MTDIAFTMGVANVAGSSFIALPFRIESSLPGVYLTNQTAGLDLAANPIGALFTNCGEEHVSNQAKHHTSGFAQMAKISRHQT